jgi:hypothetical protein
LSAVILFAAYLAYKKLPSKFMGKAKLIGRKAKSRIILLEMESVINRLDSLNVAEYEKSRFYCKKITGLFKKYLEIATDKITTSLTNREVAAEFSDSLAAPLAFFDSVCFGNVVPDYSVLKDSFAKLYNFAVVFEKEEPSNKKDSGKMAVENVF